jgi:homoprotocatechuate degradation regulator HpaR
MFFRMSEKGIAAGQRFTRPYTFGILVVIHQRLSGLRCLGLYARISMPTTYNRPIKVPSNSKSANEHTAIRSFGRSLPMLLMRAREAVMLRFRPHLRNHDVTEQQWRILRVLAEEKTADMFDLSVRCSIQPPSLSRTIPLLVERGLVNRSNHGGDQRRILVSLTSQGRSLFRTMSAESAQIYAKLESDIGTTRLAELYRVLDDLIAVAEAEGIDEAKQED